MKCFGVHRGWLSPGPSFAETGEWEVMGDLSVGSCDLRGPGPFRHSRPRLRPSHDWRLSAAPPTPWTRADRRGSEAGYSPNGAAISGPASNPLADSSHNA